MQQQREKLLVLEVQSPRPPKLRDFACGNFFLIHNKAGGKERKTRTGIGRELPAKLTQSGTDFPINGVNSSLSTSRTFRTLSLLRFPPLYIVTMAMTFPHEGPRKHLNHGTSRGQR